MECYGKQIWTNLTKDTLHELGIDPPDEAKYRAVKARWDAIAKPLDGMGRFEEITAQIGAVTDVCGRTVDGKEKFFRRTDGVMHRCRHDSG